MRSHSGSSEEAMDVSSDVDRRLAPDDLQAASAVIAEHVNRLIPCRHTSLAPDDRSARHKAHSCYLLGFLWAFGRQIVATHAWRRLSLSISVVCLCI